MKPPKKVRFASGKTVRRASEWALKKYATTFKQLADMDEAMRNFEQGRVSPPVNSQKYS